MSPGGASSLGCPVCGTPTVPGARFCFNCGAPLDQVDTDVAAERRQVTVLFGDLSDFTAWAEELDPERVGSITDTLLAALTKAVVDVEGHVDKLTGDGIMAVFGAPIAHEDDPVRGVRAAAAMQEAVGEMVAAETGGGRRLGLRVGLNTGEVLAGVQAGMSYTVVGDTVNTASRLSDAAGVGAVYAGRETALATMEVASWRALAPLRLKGKREPVPAYELVGLRSAPSMRAGLGDEAPMVGREAERGLLIGRLMDTVERGVPGSVVVVGEAGVGKTRLATELARFAGELPGLRTLWGRCTPYGQGRDLAPLVDWVRTACGLTEADLTESGRAAEKVRRTLRRTASPTATGGGLAGHVDVLLSLLGLVDVERSMLREQQAPGGPGPVDPAVEGVVALLRGLAQDAPLLLVVDDMHWASPDLLDVLAHVVRRIEGPVLLVFLGRSDLLLSDGRVEWWQALPSPEVLPLAPLEPAASERLLRAFLGGAAVDAEVRALILDRAQGNPFFLGEVLHLLVDRGLLRRESGIWSVSGELPPDVLPAGVQAVIAARFDGLDPMTKAVLRDASVVGVRFPAAVLSHIGGTDPPTVDAALGLLVERGVLRALPGQWFSFNHNLARDVAYALVPKRDRARKHAAVAAWAVTGLGAPAAEVDAVVGPHAEQAALVAGEMDLPADDPAYAVRADGAAALARLGQSALVRDDTLGAESLFTRALDLGGEGLDLSIRLPAQLGRATALVAQHRLAEAEADLLGPLLSEDDDLRTQALVVLGDLRHRQGDDGEAIAALRAVLSTAGDDGDPQVVGAALRLLGLIDYMAGRFAAAERRFRAAFERAEMAGDNRGAGWALQRLAWSATTRGDFDLAEKTLAEAQQRFGEREDAGGVAWCLGTEALVRVLQGRFTEGRRLAESLIGLADTLTDPWGLAACRAIAALAAAELGDVTVARRESAAALAAFADYQDRWGESLALVTAGLAERAAGQHGEAVLALARAVNAARAGAYPFVEATALTVLGFTHLDSAGSTSGVGEAAQALAEAERVLAGFEMARSGLNGMTVLRALVQRAHGQYDDAVTLLREAELPPDQDTLIPPRREILGLLAGTLLDAGRVDEAAEVAARAAATPAESVRARVLALRVLGDVRRVQGEPEAARVAYLEAIAIAEATEYTAGLPDLHDLAAGGGPSGPAG